MIHKSLLESYTNKKGGKSYKAEFLQRAQADAAGGIDNLRKTLSGKYRKLQYIPCGQCIECQLAYSRDKATQIMLHKKYGYNGKEYPDGSCWFLTVTYEDEYLKTHKTVNTETGEIFEGISLCMEDQQNFIKRLRNNYPEMKIQYVVAGEYGSQTYRPHYHYIIFGLPLEQEHFQKVGMNNMNQPTWELKKLSDIWGMGYVNIGRVTWESAAYVARYTLKKAFKKDKTWYQAQGMLPEFICWSNGIGKKFFEENYEKIYSSDSVAIKGGVKPPKSYDRMLKEIDPKLYEEIKYKRDKVARNNEKLTKTQYDYTPEEKRAISEARMRAVMKDLRMEV